MSSGFFRNVPFNVASSNSSPSDSASGSHAAASQWSFAGPFTASAQSSATVNHPPSPARYSPDNDAFFFDDPFEPPLFVPESSNAQQQPHFPSIHSPRQQTPPPSNQQARQNPFIIANLLNADPFDDFLNSNVVAGASTPQSDAIDLTEGVVDLTGSPNMAPARKRKRATESEKAVKRPARRSSVAKVDPGELVDLAEVDNEEEYEALKLKQKADEMKKQQLEEARRPVKLAEIQCIICMDNPTNLTVTHCGHMFCSECLHEAIYAGNNEKKSCPVCRTVIGTTLQGRGTDKKQPKNGVFHLEMKLMTSNRKGKMPQRNT